MDFPAESNTGGKRIPEGVKARVLRQVGALSRRQKRVLALSTDVALCLVSIFIAFSLRVGALDFPLRPFALYTAISTPLFIPIFYACGVYAAIFRFSGLGTVKDLGKASALYAVPLIAVFMFGTIPGVPRTIAILHPLIFLGLAAVARMAVRQGFAELARPRGSLRKVIIYGAGAAGMQLALSLRHEPNRAVVGFVDDDIRLAGQRLEGLAVRHSDELEKMVARHQVETILLALPNISRKRRSEIVDRLRHLHVQVQTLPQISELVDGRVSVADLRQIQIEDLLGRDAVSPNEILLRKAILGKRVLITGAGGSIGSELARQIAQIGPEILVLVEMTEHALYQIERELVESAEAAGTVGPKVIPELLNCCDAAAVDRVFGKWRPHTVFHAAAYKHVPLVEANVISGVRNNVFGTLNAARSALAVDVDRFVLVSTDKAVRPTNVMGASKRVCELILQGLALTAPNPRTKFAMVRFGNVLGSSGSVVPRFQDQIREGGPVTVTHRDVTRYFMTIPEAAQLVIQAGAMAEGGEVYLLEMGEPIKIYDLAATMIELSGLTVREEGSGEGDIAIVEVGLRPGEKLYEELLIGDHSSPTPHPRILKSREDFLPLGALEPTLTRLASILDEGDRAACVTLLHELVPEFTSGQGEQVKAVGN